MTPFVKGSFVEYLIEGGKKNIVSELEFQFNPEKIQKTLQIPTRPTSVNSKESTQAGETPVEKLSLTIFFNSATLVNSGISEFRNNGIGPQLGLLEKYARPLQKNNDGKANVNFQDKISLESKNKAPAKTPEPANAREEYPKVLFVWGEQRILPVIFESFSVNEVQFDSQLNPTQAEVSVGLVVIGKPENQDSVAQGALQYTDLKQKNKIDLLLKLSGYSTKAVDLYKLR